MVEEKVKKRSSQPILAMYATLLKQHGSLHCDCNYCILIRERRALELSVRRAEVYLDRNYEIYNYQMIMSEYHNINSIKHSIATIKEKQKELKLLK